MKKKGRVYDSRGESDGAEAATPPEPQQQAGEDPVLGDFMPLTESTDAQVSAHVRG